VLLADVLAERIRASAPALGADTGARVIPAPADAAMPGILSAERVTKEVSCPAADKADRRPGPLARDRGGRVPLSHRRVRLRQVDLAQHVSRVSSSRRWGKCFCGARPSRRIEAALRHGVPVLRALPWKTVRGNVEFGPKMKGLPAAERHRIADRFIELVKLRGFEDRYPTELRAAMQQGA